MTTYRFHKGSELIYVGDGTAPGAYATNGWPDAWLLDLPLPGWDDLSVWGQDMGTWWAQLSPNGTHRDDDPVIWLSGIPTRIVTIESLVTQIATATGTMGTDVRQAIAVSAAAA